MSLSSGMGLWWSAGNNWAFVLLYMGHKTNHGKLSCRQFNKAADGMKDKEYVE